MYCQCGCGAEAPISKLTRRGYRKGDRMRFVQGHHTRLPEYKVALYTTERSAKISAAHADGRIPPLEHRAGESHPNWRGEDVGYGQAHARLGSAVGYVCVCGAAAGEWALNHAYPNLSNEERGGRLVSFSTDRAAYVPLCVSCHRKADARGGFRG